jgi:sarcosine oxidase, subunit gamma
MADTSHTAGIPFAHLLEGFHERSAATGGLIRLREVPRKAQISLRGDVHDQAFRNAIHTVLGLELPTTANTTNTVSSPITVLWLGPDEWLIVGEPGAEQRIIPQLKNSLGSLHSSVIDVSDARTILEISGARSRILLAKGCSLDLHPRVFHPGTCVQTNLARTNVILQLHDRVPTWLIYVRISFARYLTSWLFDAMTEFCVSNPGNYEGVRGLVKGA